MKILSEKDVKRLIDNKIKESIHLEYKACYALRVDEESRKELSKDVSSFANSDGGQIIYGVIEKNNIPLKIDVGYGKKNKINREWIEQVINSKISPKIEDIVITPINLSNSDKYIYVVEIPQSNRSPHQASDRKFYKRYNFQSVAMEEYGIRELYFKNIISQSEFRKLQAQVRENIYKPLYTQIIRLKDFLNKEKHPKKIYYNDISPLILDDVSEYYNSFSIWNDMKKGGQDLDISGIGDNDLIEYLDSLGEDIKEYNYKNEELYKKINVFLKGITGYSDWEYIKEEIYSGKNNIGEYINTLKLLRKSKKKEWQRKMPDGMLIDKLRREIKDGFSDKIKKTDRIAKEIIKKVNKLKDILKKKIKRTFPVS